MYTESPTPQASHLLLHLIISTHIRHPQITHHRVYAVERPPPHTQYSPLLLLLLRYCTILGIATNTSITMERDKTSPSKRRAVSIPKQRLIRIYSIFHLLAKPSSHQQQQPHLVPIYHKQLSAMDQIPCPAFRNPHFPWPTQPPNSLSSVDDDDDDDRE